VGAAPALGGHDGDRPADQAMLPRCASVSVDSVIKAFQASAAKRAVASSAKLHPVALRL